MKYRVIAPIIFILGILGIAIFMNRPDEPVQQQTSPAAPPPPQSQTDQQFKNLKIP